MIEECGKHWIWIESYQWLNFLADSDKLDFQCS